MTEKRIVNIASYKRTESLVKTLESIIDQCDELNVALNDFESELPSILYHEKVNIYFTDNSKGDAFKFLKLSESDGYFLTIDDDLIYPPNYVDFMIAKCKEYGNTRIITLHGRNFPSFPIISYYKSASERYACLDKVKNNVMVQFGGTGVMCFHTNLFKLNLDYFIFPNMADIWIGKYCIENKIEILCVRHEAGYIQYIPQNKTIYDDYNRNDTIQTKVVNSIFDKSIIITEEDQTQNQNTEQETKQYIKEKPIQIKSTIEVTKKTINYDSVNNTFQQNQKQSINRTNQSVPNKFNRNNTMVLKSFQKKR
jgi:hypothetical protein